MRKIKEPDEIIEARELLKEFEKSPGLSKKSSFSEAIETLNHFLTKHPYSKFSERANNLKKTYIELLIKKVGATSFPNADDWFKTLLVLLKFNSEIEALLESHPELKKDWRNFLEQWGYEFSEALKLSQPE